MMVPVGRLVLLRTTPKSEMVDSLAYLTVPALIGPVVGPPLGGFITTYFHWRWIFWINVPIGVLGIALTLRFIENVREQDGRALRLPRVLAVRARPAEPRLRPDDHRPRARSLLGAVAALIVGGAALLALYVAHARRAAQRDHRSRTC